MGDSLENMSALAAANSEVDVQQKLRSPELWRRLELYRLALISSSSSREGRRGKDRHLERKLALGLLNDVEPRLLFVAVDFSHGQGGDESKRRAVEASLLAVLGSPVGPELLRENNAELVPFLMAGLYHPVAGVKILTAKALMALGLGGGAGGGGDGGGEGRGMGVQPDEREGERPDRCRSLLQPPLLPALVAGLGDGSTGVAQVVADTIVSLCEEGERPQSTAAAAVSGTMTCRRAVMGALVAQLGDVVAGLTDRQASTPKLRFADTAARLMSSSDAAFEAAVDTGALSLVTRLTADASDVLLQLNALEVLEQVASTASGARHLISRGHMDKLLLSAGGGEGEGESAEAPDPLLGAGALRALSKVLAKAEGAGLDVWRERSPSFVRGFLRACTVHIEDHDEATKLAGIVAASTAAGASNEALKAMLSREHGREGLLDAWLTLSAHKVDVKAAALHALALVLGPPVQNCSTPSTVGEHRNDQDGDQVMGNTAGAAAAPTAADGGGPEERVLLCKQIFERLGVCNTPRPAGALLLELARQPVPEVRHAAYDVMRCAAWQPGGWGLSAMFSQPGFRGFLEDRDVGSSKATKEWKFSVVESIMSCKDRGALGHEVLDAFRNFLKQGPFWVPSTRRNVATAE